MDRSLHGGRSADAAPGLQNLQQATTSPRCHTQSYRNQHGLLAFSLSLGQLLPVVFPQLQFGNRNVNSDAGPLKSVWLVLSGSLSWVLKLLPDAKSS